MNLLRYNSLYPERRNYIISEKFILSENELNLNDSWIDLEFIKSSTVFVTKIFPGIFSKKYNKKTYEFKIIDGKISSDSSFVLNEELLKIINKLIKLNLFS